MTEQHPLETIFILDESGIITACSQRVKHVLGWSPTELRGKSFAELVFPSSDGLPFSTHWAQIIAKDKEEISSWTREEILLQCDGTPMPVELHICALQGQNGRTFMLTTNINKRLIPSGSQLEKIVRNQSTINFILEVALLDATLEEILRNILEYVLNFSIPTLQDKGAVFLVADDSEHLVLAAQKGFSPEQQQRCNRIPYGTCYCGRAALYAEIQFAGNVDHGHDIRVQNAAPHGHYCVPICSGDNLLGVLALYLQEGHTQNDTEHDMLKSLGNILAGVIQRKTMEQQRQHLIHEQRVMISHISNEKKFTESIIQSINAGLIICNRQNELIYINQHGKNILSQFLDQGDSNSEEADRFSAIPAIQRMLELRVMRVDKLNEIIQINKRGEKRTLQYCVVPRENAFGERVGSIIQFKEITETVRLRLEMEKMNRLSTVAEIASAVAHEVRNPLAGIKTMSQAIEENCTEDDENKEYITRIIKQVDRLNALLTDFFTYAKPGKAKRQEISIPDTVREVRQLFKVKLFSKKIALEESYAEGLPKIFVDPNQLQQVLLNLMLNAIDAVSSNGKIRISAQLADPQMRQIQGELLPELKKNTTYVAMYFQDDGKGMTSKIEAKAFEPFFTTKHHGTGLGLATVYRIINANDGFITIDSTYKNGVGFIMLFESVDQ